MFFLESDVWNMRNMKSVFFCNMLKFVKFVFYCRASSNALLVFGLYISEIVFKKWKIWLRKETTSNILW